MTQETAPSGERPSDAEQMAREWQLKAARMSEYGWVRYVATALQSLHDAHEAEVRTLRAKLEKATAEERFRDYAHRNG